MVITCVSVVQMDHASPLQTYMFQKPFNDIRNSSIQWVLTPIIAFWRFGSPLGLEFPKWEFIWECEGSFLHTLLHSQEHETWLPGFLLGPHPCKPCLGCKPKAKVTIFFFDMDRIRFRANHDPILDLQNWWIHYINQNTSVKKKRIWPSTTQITLQFINWTKFKQGWGEEKYFSHEDMAIK